MSVVSLGIQPSFIWLARRKMTLCCFLLFFFCSGLQVDVIVDLGPSEGNSHVSRDVVLVLKCTQPVKWVVKPHSVIGKLEVVVR